MILLATLLLAAAGLNVHVENKTGSTITAMHIEPADSGTWGNDVLGEAVVDDKKSIDITIPSTEFCRYDISVRLSDGSTRRYAKVNLCETSDVILK